MPDPTLLYCVGATKAGTSALYRYLHDHDACKLPPVKEAHYWDTFDADAQAKQVLAFERRLTDLQAALVSAKSAGQGRKITNLGRQIASMRALIDVLQSDRAGDLNYANWLMTDAEDAAVIADMTPSYALEEDATLNRMMQLSPMTKFIYLMRDPVERLWSHVRMQARRTLAAGESYAQKAHAILQRVMAGGETHLTARGDYATAVTKLRRVVPHDRLMLGFSENMSRESFVQTVTSFLGIMYKPNKTASRVHAGDPVELGADMRVKLAVFLRDQYEFVANNIAALPDAWQHNMKRATL